ncbi:nuclear transport factor 2 family protein [Desertimonas flava]|uniref:nuclear transport factor 2 family protein n=1 Tax=Desertimonas flava TaxID=2064846 RepID=UPI000E34B8B3|nr:nuclear transport factor 2 family protein [Desertimonas flava]
MTEPTALDSRDPELLRVVSEAYYDYAEAADDADPEAFAANFTNDCRFDGGRPVPSREWIAGHARRLLGLFRETSHHISQVRVRSVDGDVVHATAYVQAWHRKLDGDTFWALGSYRSALRLDEGRWRFCEHSIVLHGNEGSDGREYLRRPRNDLSAPTTS